MRHKPVAALGQVDRGKTPKDCARMQRRSCQATKRRLMRGTGPASQPLLLDVVAAMADLGSRDDYSGRRNRAPSASCLASGILAARAARILP